MREGFGRFAYCLRRAARGITLVLAFCLIAVFCSERCRADAKQFSDSVGTTNRMEASIQAPSEIGRRDDLIVPDNVGGNSTESDNPAAAPKADTSENEPTPTPKPKKQLAAEQYALGVILAGGIAIGMMIALFFYYTKQNNGPQD